MGISDAPRSAWRLRYHQFLTNIIGFSQRHNVNLTAGVLPLVAPSFLGARILGYLRLHVRFSQRHRREI